MRTIRKNILLFVLLGAGTARAEAPPKAQGEAPGGAPIDYGQLGAILGYVASDYPTAVGPAGVLDPQEYSEQKGFLAEAVQEGESLPADDLDVRSLLQAAQASANRAAPPDQVVARVTDALRLLEQRHDLGQIPKEMPSATRGRQLYAEGCEICHAADGSGHTKVVLPTVPPDFTDRRVSGEFSPSRVFRAESYGLPGTAMPGFNLAYSMADRWSIAFYMLGLPHGAVASSAGTSLPAPTKPKVGGGLASLAELARQSDDQLRARLAGQEIAPEARERALDWLRLEAPYAAPDTASVAGEGKILSSARQAVAEVQRLYRAGQVPAARHAAITAYLDDFEPFEAALRARAPGLVTTLEASFMHLRAGIDAGASPQQLDAIVSDLQRGLLEAEDAVSTGSPWVAFTASLAIALREGLEAALFLSVMLALAIKSGRPRAQVAVHLGWMAALLLGGATWFLSGALVASGGGRNRELTEGITVLLTAALLLGASNWLLAQASARKLGQFLSQRVQMVKGAGWGLGLLAFFAIYREAFEVVVFYRGLLLQSANQSGAVSLGAVVGLVLLAGVVVVFQRLVGHKLRPRPLLVTSGVLLCALAVMMVGEGIRSLQEAGVMGQRLVPFPEVPQLGIFATVEGLAAQGSVLLVLLASLLYSLRRRRVELVAEGALPVISARPPETHAQKTAS
jgi:high-affinity iron transporter